MSSKLFDAEEYIASGKIELYASGLGTPKEREEVEQLARDNPRIARELAAVKDAFDTILYLSTKDFARQPPYFLKSLALKSSFAETPVTDDDIIRLEVKYPIKKKDVLNHGKKPFKPPKKEKDYIKQARQATLGLIVVGCFAFILAVAFTHRAIVYHSLSVRSDSLRTALTSLKKREVTYLHKIDSLWLASADHIELKTKEGTDVWHGIVYYQPNRGEAMASIDNLPALKPDRCYQLWARVLDDVIINMGVLPMQGVLMFPTKVGEAHFASSFFVTEEAAPGVKKPHMENLRLVGKAEPFIFF